MSPEVLIQEQPSSDPLGPRGYIHLPAQPLVSLSANVCAGTPPGPGLGACSRSAHGGAYQ